MSDYQPQHASDSSSEEPVVGDAPPKADVLLSNSVYDKVVASSLYFLPVLAAAYFGLAQIWGFPKAEEVLGSVAVFETLLGAVVKFSRAQYANTDAKFDGRIHVEPDTDAYGDPVSNVNVSLDPMALAHKKEILVKVTK